MAAALIRIDQAANPSPIGQAGRSRDDIVLGSPVVLRNANDDGVNNHFWEIVDQPSLTSPDALSNPLDPAPVFTPTSEGTYLIRLTVNDGREGEVDERLVVIRDANGLRFPAAFEGLQANWNTTLGSPNEKGWWPDLKLLINAGISLGSRLTRTPNPVLGGVAGAYTYTIAADELLTFFDGGGPGAPPTLTITLPPIASIAPGQLIGLQLTAGNPNYDVILTPDAADLVIDPITNTPAGGAGASLTISAGTLPAGALLIWEGAKTGTAAWEPRGDRDSLGTGGGGATEAVTDPAKTGGPGTNTLATGDRVFLLDAGTPTGDMDVDLPAIVPGDAGQGHRCSVVLPYGNPNDDVVITPAAGQGVYDENGNVVISLTYPAGTFPAYTVLGWEAAPNAGPQYPGTITPPLVPDFYSGFLPNFFPVNVVISGTGGTLPAAIDLEVYIGPVLCTINSAVQGVPGGAWTIDVDIPGSALPPGPGLFDCYVYDISVNPAPTDIYAVLFEAFFSGGPSNPGTPYGPPADVWVLESPSLSAGAGGRWDESLAAGPNTNGNDAYILEEDAIYWSLATAPLGDPTSPPPSFGFPPQEPSVHKKWPIAHEVAPIDGSTWSTATTLMARSGEGLTDGAQNRIWLKIVVGRKLEGLAIAGGTRFGIIEQRWTFQFAGWVLDETIHFSPELTGFVRVTGVAFGDLILEFLDDATRTVRLQAVAERQFLVGYNPE